MSSAKSGQPNKQRWTEPIVPRSSKSPIEGVDMLREGKNTNFVSVKSQLYDKLQADYGNLCSFIETGVLWFPDEPDPTDIDERYPTLSAKSKEALFTSKILEHEKRISRCKDDYSKIFGQIKQTLDAIAKDKVERSAEYDTAKKESNPCTLWRIIERVIGMQVAVGDLDDSRQTVKMLYQGERMTNSDTLLTFYKRFKLRYEHCGLIGVVDIPDEAGCARDFYSKLDSSRYAKLYATKRNNCKRGIESWPDDLQEAYEEVDGWIEPSWRSSDTNPGRPAVFSVTSDDGEFAQPARTKPWMEKPCHSCGKLGHWKSHCPELTKSSLTARAAPPAKEKVARKTVLFSGSNDNEGDGAVSDDAYNIFALSSSVYHGGSQIACGPMEFIYDTGADTCVVRDESTLFAVHATAAGVAMTGATGTQTFTTIGVLPCFGNCVVVPTCPVNLISADVAERLHKVTHQPGVNFIVCVHGVNFVFSKRDNGFYICDFSVHMNDLRDMHRTHSKGVHAWTVSVHDKEIHYSKREVRAAEQARELQRALGYPSRQGMVDALRHGAIVNCPVTINDIARAEDIFGTSVPVLKGKTTDPGPAQEVSVTVQKSSRRDIELYVDIMHVLEVPVLIAVAKPLNLLLASSLDVKRKADQVGSAILSIVGKLKSNGFHVKAVIADAEPSIAASEPMLSAEGIPMRQVSAGSHVQLAERAIRVIKERIRCVVSELVWTLPKCLARWVVYYCVSRINSMPRTSSSIGISAREEFRGVKLDYHQDLCLSFGDYVQAYRTPAVKNSLSERTAGAIALTPMDNHTRSWVFINLITLRTFTASKWTLLPTPDIVISRMKEVADRGLAVLPDDGPPPLIDIRDVRPEDNLPMDDREPVRDIAPREVPVDVDVDDNSSDEDSSPIVIDIHAEHGGDKQDMQSAPSAQSAPESGPVLRRSQRVTAHVHIVSGNMTIGKAQKLHGAKADAALLSELTQMITKKVKEKRDQEGKLIKIKARLVAGGDEQDRKIYTVEKRTSPTVHPESLFCVFGLAASKGMGVGSIDIEAAFLEPDLPTPILMVIDRKASTILGCAFPELAAYLNENGCLVVELLKALYGLVEAAQLWHIKLSEAMVSFGLKVSTIDRCVFYGVLHGHRLYACIHVDDIAVMSVDVVAAVGVLTKCLDGVFTKANPDVSNPLTFLGMRITTTSSAMFVDMNHFEDESCESWGAISALAVPATSDLFEDDAESPLLPRHTTALLLSCCT